ncbi:MAG: hypothetical protein K2M79_04125, partial [Muribaculaceae bacterium]|nr:hypothetical protein [Muribaculaceae bacterium]
CGVYPTDGSLSFFDGEYESHRLYSGLFAGGCEPHRCLSVLFWWRLRKGSRSARRGLTELFSKGVSFPQWGIERVSAREHGYASYASD